MNGLDGGVVFYLIEDADHAFHVPVRTGRKDDKVLAKALAEPVTWMAGR